MQMNYRCVRDKVKLIMWRVAYCGRIFRFPAARGWERQKRQERRNQASYPIVPIVRTPHIIVELASWLNKFVCKWKTENQFRYQCGRFLGSPKFWRSSQLIQFEKDWNVVRSVRQEESLSKKKSATLRKASRMGSTNSRSSTSSNLLMVLVSCQSVKPNFDHGNSVYLILVSLPTKKNQPIKYLLIELNWAISRSIRHVEFGFSCSLALSNWQHEELNLRWII